jgi:hypothetical protein
MTFQGVYFIKNYVFEGRLIAAIAPPRLDWVIVLSTGTELVFNLTVTIRKSSRLT